MATRTLVTRWSLSHEALKAYERILKTLTKGGEITAKHSPFERVDGRIDLRGLQIEGKQEWFFIRNMTVRGTDFSSCALKRVWLEDCHFEDVNFGMADLFGLCDHRNHFSQCSFVGTSLKEASLGHKGSSYEDCRFEAANFAKASFVRGEFDQCDFVNCKVKDVDFNACSFEDCTFEGLLKDVWFRGRFPLESDTEYFGTPRKNRMRNVSFEKARLWGLTVSDDCDLSTVRMPLEGDYRLYSSRKQRLKRLKAAIPFWSVGEEQKRQASIFADSYLVHAENEAWLLLNVDEIKEDYGDALTARFLQVLDSPV